MGRGAGAAAPGAATSRGLPRRLGKGGFWLGILILIPALLLYLPVFYYSLTTPFGLVDDYFLWQLITLLDEPARLVSWLKATFVPGINADLLDPQGRRYKPVWEFYGAVVWKVFGPNPALHHLSRWLLHFGAVLAFAAAFWRIAGHRSRAESSSAASPGWRWLYRLLPLALLVYVCLFFPNMPAARLGPQEVYSAFFLGFCNWMAVLLLTADREGGNGRAKWWMSSRLHYALFVLSYLGLALSKETNIAAALALLVGWYALGLARYGVNRRVLRGGLPLLLIFGLVLEKVYAAAQANGVGYGYPFSPQAFLQNAGQIYAGLLQTETSGIIAGGFIVLLAALTAAVIGKIRRRMWDKELGFILLLLGQGLALSLLLSASYGVALRYWHILIPILAVLLALAAGQLLRGAAAGSPAWRYGMAAVLAGFILFFTAANYYNFLYQTLAQHSARQGDAAAIAAAARLHNAGEYVHINTFRGTEQGHIREEPLRLLKGYPRFAARFHNQQYVFHSEPPTDAAQPWYSVVWYFPPDILPTALTWRSRENYPVLAYARPVAAFLQGGPPHQSLDAGAFPLGEYRISLHRRPADLPALAARLRAESTAAVEDGGFAVYLWDNRLIYYKERCTVTETRSNFRLHLTPVDIADLPPRRQEAGFANMDFSFQNYGLRLGMACIAGRELPDYPIQSIRAGQYPPDRESGRVAGRESNPELLWESRLIPYRVTAADYAAIQAGEWGPPLARSFFALYRRGNTLAYVKEPCAPADTAAGFFLHLTPRNSSDLPPQRRKHGFVSLDFAFADYGLQVGAACLAARQLPEYAARSAISAGQFHPDKGDLWRVELPAVE